MTGNKTWGPKVKKKEGFPPSPSKHNRYAYRVNVLVYGCVLCNSYTDREVRLRIRLTLLAKQFRYLM